MHKRKKKNNNDNKRKKIKYFHFLKNIILVSLKLEITTK